MLTTAYHMLGDHGAELEAARRCREQHPDNVHALLMETRALAALGRTDDVDARIDDAARLCDEPSVQTLFGPGWLMQGELIRPKG